MSGKSSGIFDEVLDLILLSGRVNKAMFDDFDSVVAATRAMIETRGEQAAIDAGVRDMVLDMRAAVDEQMAAAVRLGTISKMLLHNLQVKSNTLQ